MRKRECVRVCFTQIVVRVILFLNLSAHVDDQHSHYKEDLLLKIYTRQIGSVILKYKSVVLLISVHCI